MAKHLKPVSMVSSKLQETPANYKMYSVQSLFDDDSRRHPDGVVSAEKQNQSETMLLREAEAPVKTEKPHKGSSKSYYNRACCTQRNSSMSLHNETPVHQVSVLNKEPFCESYSAAASPMTTLRTCYSPAVNTSKFTVLAPGIGNSQAAYCSSMQTSKSYQMYANSNYARNASQILYSQGDQRDYFVGNDCGTATATAPTACHSYSNMNITYEELAPTSPKYAARIRLQPKFVNSWELGDLCKSRASNVSRGTYSRYADSTTNQAQTTCEFYVSPSNKSQKSQCEMPLLIEKLPDASPKLACSFQPVFSKVQPATPKSKCAEKADAAANAAAAKVHVSSSRVINETVYCSPKYYYCSGGTEDYRAAPMTDILTSQTILESNPLGCTHYLYDERSRSSQYVPRSPHKVIYRTSHASSSANNPSIDRTNNNSVNNITNNANINNNINSESNKNNHNSDISETFSDTISDIYVTASNSENTNNTSSKLTDNKDGEFGILKETTPRSDTDFKKDQSDTLENVEDIRESEKLLDCRVVPKLELPSNAETKNQTDAQVEQKSEINDSKENKPEAHVTEYKGEDTTNDVFGGKQFCKSTSQQKESANESSDAQEKISANNKETENQHEIADLLTPESLTKNFSISSLGKSSNQEQIAFNGVFDSGNFDSILSNDNDLSDYANTHTTTTTECLEVELETKSSNANSSIFEEAKASTEGKKSHSFNKMKSKEYQVKRKKKRQSRKSKKEKKEKKDCSCQIDNPPRELIKILATNSFSSNNSNKMPNLTKEKIGDIYIESELNKENIKENYASKRLRFNTTFIKEFEQKELEEFQAIKTEDEKFKRQHLDFNWERYCVTIVPWVPEEKRQEFNNNILQFNVDNYPFDEFISESRQKIFKMKIKHYNVENCEDRYLKDLKTSNIIHIRFNFVSPDGDDTDNIYDSHFTHSKNWRKQLPIHQLLVCSSLVLQTPGIKKLPINAIARKRVYAHYRAVRLESIMRQFVDNIRFNIYQPGLQGYWWRFEAESFHSEPKSKLPGSPVNYSKSDSTTIDKKKVDVSTVVKNKNLVLFDWESGSMRIFETGDNSVIQACTHLNKVLVSIYNAKWNNESLFEPHHTMLKNITSLPLKATTLAYFEDNKYPVELDNAEQLIVEFYSKEKNSIMSEKMIKLNEPLSYKDAVPFVAFWASEDGILLNSAQPILINDPRTHSSLQYVLSLDSYESQLQFVLSAYTKKIFQTKPKLLHSTILRKFDQPLNFLQLKLYYKQCVWFILMLLQDQSVNSITI